MMTMNLCKSDVVDILKRDGYSAVENNVIRVVNQNNLTLELIDGIGLGITEVWRWRFDRNFNEQIIDFLNPIAYLDNPTHIAIGNLRVTLNTHNSQVNGNDHALAVALSNVYPQAQIQDTTVSPTIPKTIATYVSGVVSTQLDTISTLLQIPIRNKSWEYAAANQMLANADGFNYELPIKAFDLRVAINVGLFVQFNVDVQMFFDGWICYLNS